MTAQEIQDRDGFLIGSSPVPIAVGSVITIHDHLAKGSTVLVIGEATLAEARKQSESSGLAWPPKYGILPHFYKTVAE